MDQQFAQAQQAALNALNEKLNSFPPNPTVVAPLSGVLQNLQVAVTVRHPYLPYHSTIT
jgi:hypothetical protein